MTITVKHSKTNSIADWTQSQLDAQIAAGNFPVGTTLANIVLPSDWNNDHTLVGVGTMAEQNADNAAITGGSIDGTAIGATTASTGSFTTLIGGADAANYGQLTGGATTKAIEWKSLGSDTNVAFAIRSKGTGAIDLAAGSSGVNISNGGTVTAITRTAIGSGYTGFPSVAISAPTTAGGVQAVASSQLVASNTTIAGGGTGYTLNDVLTVSTAGGSSAITITVTGVTGGVITSATATSSSLTTIPTSPVSVTGGTGSGATFNLIYVVSATFTITNAGSGYIEQPTVTFSGGGGSGAAAYATVGAGSVIRALGATGTQALDFYTPASATNAVPTFRIRDTSGDSYFMAQVQGGSAILTAQGNTNANAMISSNGTGSITLRTNGGSQVEQLRVSHTASAVNYVQVTGAATGAGASALGGIQMTGSDANPNFAIGTKGTGYIAFFGAATTSVHAFRIITTSASASGNLIAVQGAASGSAPSIQAISGPSGTDTNIDLALTPKGTGNVRFGTYTATVLTPTGYITVKDSGGTTRRLLVG